VKVSTALRLAYERRGWTQREFGRRVGYSDTMISEIVRGNRVMAPDVAARAARILDDPRLYTALALEATGGIGPRWFDGPAVDRHRMSRLHETMAEARELLEALARSRAISERPSEAMRVECREIADRLTDIIDQALNLLGQICLEGDVSYAEAWLDRHGELREKGFIEEVKRRAA